MTSDALTSEWHRQTVHVLAGALALTLPWLTWPQAVLIGASGVVFNLVLLPRLSPRLFRPADRRRPLLSGIVLYPAAVLGLVLCFPSRLDLAAIAWVILAAGDGMATLVGTHVRTPPLPWNRQKSIGGLAAFAISGSAAAIGTAWWMRHYAAAPGADAFALVVVPILATVAAAFVESVPIKLNDNLSVPATAALVLWSCSVVDPGIFATASGLLIARLWPAIALNVTVAALGYWARTVTVPGATAGAVIGVAIFFGTGLAGWLVLFASFLLAAATTRIGLQRKLAAGIAEERGGRRGAGNAIANTGLAAFASVLSLGSLDDLPRLAMVTALATSASDTVASEIGKAWGRTTWLITGFRRVPPGTSGAVSLEGTTAGILSAALLAWLAAVLGVIGAEWIGCVVAGATLASLVESALGATLETGGTLNNDALNFVNATIGSGLAIACARWL